MKPALIDQIIFYGHAAVIAIAVLVLVAAIVRLVWSDIIVPARDNEQIEAEYGRLLAWARAVPALGSGERRGVARHRLRWWHHLTLPPRPMPRPQSDRLVASAPVVLSDHMRPVDEAFAQLPYPAAGRASLSVPFDRKIRDDAAALRALNEGLRFEDTAFLPVQEASR
ncbi:hypothetical protein [Micromonospora sp. NPDC049891]|uniref:hypothetical protein n=1 Tax=Micromonospora sp. NPDC049891 TaxID=3155655 RepID=UPI0033FF536B